MSKPTLVEYLAAVKEPRQKGKPAPGLVAFRKWYETHGGIIENELADGIANVRDVALSGWAAGRRDGRGDIKVLVKMVNLLRVGLHRWISSRHPAPAEALELLPELEALVPEEKP